MLKVVDRWTTIDGEWNPSGKPYSIDKEHAEKYGAENIPGRGGASHIFVKAAPGSIVLFFTSDGHADNTRSISVGQEGWVNFPMWKSAAYWGNEGPWCVMVNGIQVARGLGLPEGFHVSTFLVVGYEGQQPEPQPEPTPTRDRVQVLINGAVVYDSEG